MKGKTRNIAVFALLVFAFALASVSAASAKTFTAPTVTATATGGNTVEVSGCGYSLSGITVKLTRSGSIGTVARGGTKPAGCFDVHTFVSSPGTWTVTAFDTSGDTATTTVTVS